MSSCSLAPVIASSKDVVAEAEVELLTIHCGFGCVEFQVEQTLAGVLEGFFPGSSGSGI